MAQKAFKFKLSPTNKQQQRLSQFCGCARFIYNWGLDRAIKQYEETKKPFSYNDLAKELTLLKQQDDTKWLKDCPAVCLQQSLRNLDTAFRNFFRKCGQFPKFKSRKQSKNVCKFIASVQFDFSLWRVKIPKIGWVKLRHNRTFDLSTCKLGTLTVYRDKCGTFWCTVLVSTDEQPLPKAKVVEHTSVGVDLGLKDYAILSDGTKYANPKFLERTQKHLTTLQRKFARTRNGSKRHERRRLYLARCYRRITDQRVDYLHKVSSDLIHKYDTICLEDLNVDGMLKNHCLAKGIQSASWSEFVRQLVYKAEWYGKNVVFVGRFEPTSQLCSSCGSQNKAVKDLSVRQWTCPVCGAVHDRDVNAAKNIKDLGLRSLNTDKPIPSASGIMDVEGNDSGHPKNRQDSKSTLER